MLPIDGATHTVPLLIAIKSALVAQVSMLSADVRNIIVCPYWTNTDATNIYITTDYEIGQGYTGNGNNIVAWVLIATN